MGSVAINFVGGIPFQLLYDGVKVAVQKARKFRTNLIDLEFTLDCLHSRILEQIGQNNIQLNLPNNIVEDLETKMNEGIQLVVMLSKLSMWNIHIWGNCYNCIGPDCAAQLDELDRSLRRLLELLELEQRRNVTELLCLARAAKDKQDDLEKKQYELEKKVDAILRGQKKIYAILMEQHDVNRKMVPNGEQQAPSSSKGVTADPALGAGFRQLIDVVALVAVENRMFQRLLKTLKSTLYCIQPLIEEVTEHGRVLHLPNQEVKKLIPQIENAVEFFLRCSKVGKHVNYKKYKHAHKILDLNESLQKLLIELKEQVEKNVKEALDSANKIEMAIRKIEAEDLCIAQLPEHSSPAVEMMIREVEAENMSVQPPEHPPPAIGIDMQGSGQVTEDILSDSTSVENERLTMNVDISPVKYDVITETLLDSISVEDEGVKQIEDNSAVKCHMDIQYLSDMTPQLFSSRENFMNALKIIQHDLSFCAPSTPSFYSSSLTPPESKNSSFTDSDEFRSTPSMLSYSSGAGNEKRLLSGNSQEVYANSSFFRQMSYAWIVKFAKDEIYKATKSFSPSMKIGKGGFGTVYKGRLDDGTLVAIKRAKKSVYDKHLDVEFQSEIQMLSQVEHLNLVKFYGYVEYEDEKIVVVEYVPNGTLRQHLDLMLGNILDLATRLDIAIDVAHAVTYLHMYTDHPIIHRDIKSSNILLTENLRAKVANFGFARLAADSDSGATHVSTQVKGTAGYLDPEYLRTYQLTEKSDVYSFGVLLVELVTGRRPIEAKRELKERITVKWAMKKFTDGDTILILDPRLERNAANNLAIEKILELSLQCLAPHRQHRPSMKRCAEILWSIRKDYKEMLAPDFRSTSTRSQRSTATREE